MTNPLPIRIHHFFDIIRDFGINPKIEPNQKYHHSYHTVATCIRNNPDLKLEIVIGPDAVCAGCAFHRKGTCTDKIDKPGFSLKRQYNDFLDRKILGKINVREHQIITARELCYSADNYLSNMYSIYNLNAVPSTSIRHMHVINGLNYYKKAHNFSLNLA